MKSRRLTLYGIPNCDTCRKALKWLGGQGIAYRFHDLRTDGVTNTMAQRWLSTPFADRLVNRRSTTWRDLDKTQRAVSGDALAHLLAQYPTLVKRPVFECDGEVLAVGFDPRELAHAFT